MPFKLSPAMLSSVRRMLRRGNLVTGAACRMMSSKESDHNGPIFTEYEEPPLPEWQEKHGETCEVKKARLLYQSRKRGMLENGLLLSTFAAEYLNRMSEAELEQYDFLINKPSNDWEIYQWAVGVKDVPEEYQTPVMDQLKEHASNKKGESRICQPDLYDEK